MPNPTLPPALARLARAGAEPALVAVALERLVSARPSVLDRLLLDGAVTPLATAVVEICRASNALARLLVSDPGALDVLEDLDTPVAMWDGSPAGPVDAGGVPGRKARELLRIAARDLLEMDGLEQTGAALAALATDVMRAAVSAATGQPVDQAGSGMLVVGMGKLGGAELNYSSDIDIVFVATDPAADREARQVLELGRQCFRVDAALRPEGRSGPLVRTVQGYRSYWERWAQPWERQAMLKARPVAGDPELAAAFADAADEYVWGSPFGADELSQVRAMKRRTETLVRRHGDDDRDVKRGPGGIRDVEFSVQLLQLVHGWLDPTIRSRSTLPALAQLAAAGYVDSADADVLARGYRFLRSVEHRVQLVEEEQAHVVPAAAGPAHRLARVLGFRDGPETTADALLARELRRYQADIRTVHERLYFRPLLEAFAALAPSGRAGATPGPADVMSPEAVATRLGAFGFADAERTRAAVSALVRGLTRTSRLMAQMLPLILDWLSESPDPDLGLQQLRDLVVRHHQRALLVPLFRESPEAARRLCLLLGTSRLLGEGVVRDPDMLRGLADDAALLPAGRDEGIAQLGERVRSRDVTGDHRGLLVRFHRSQFLRIATRDLLDLDELPATATALTDMHQAVLQVAMDLCGGSVPWCAVGLGRLGGGEVSYASDLDLVLVCADGAGPSATVAAEALVALLHGNGPFDEVVRIDLRLRPEGEQGRLVRDMAGYRAYAARWAQTWERQALVRARVVAGDAEVGRQFMGLVDELVWGQPFTAADIAAVRRMKARVERERIPASEDRRFHLKLGPGALADVEWTVQLLQLQHGVPEPGTMAALDALERAEIVGADDAARLREAYRFCERTRNRWFLVGALPGGTAPGDSLPARPEQLAHLARSLGTTPSQLRDEYRRVTRRARGVVERLFYEMPG